MTSLDVFFSNLSALGVDEGHMLLGAGHPTPEIRRWLDENLVSDPALPQLPTEFRGARLVRLAPSTLATLENFATREPVPVIAIHICVCTPSEALLEWYDLPSDPIYVAPCVHEDCVAAFATACGVEYACESGS